MAGADDGDAKRRVAVWQRSSTPRRTLGTPGEATARRAAARARTPPPAKVGTVTPPAHRGRDVGQRRPQTTSRASTPDRVSPARARAVHGQPRTGSLKPVVLKQRMSRPVRASVLRGMSSTTSSSRLPGAVRCIIAADTTVWCAESNGNVSIREKDGTTFGLVQRGGSSPRITCMVFVHGGYSSARVLFGHANGTVAAVDAAKGERRSPDVRVHEGAVAAMAVTGDGMVLTGGDDRELVLLNPHTMDVVASVGTAASPVTCLAVGTGRYFSGSACGVIQAWEPSHPTPVASATLGGPVSDMVMLGRHVWVAAHHSPISLLDCMTLDGAASLGAVRDGVTRIIACGAHVWAYHDTGTITVWNLQTLTQSRTLHYGCSGATVCAVKVPTVPEDAEVWTSNVTDGAVRMWRDQDYAVPLWCVQSIEEARDTAHDAAKEADACRASLKAAGATHDQEKHRLEEHIADLEQRLASVHHDVDTARLDGTREASTEAERRKKAEVELGDLRSMLVGAHRDLHPEHVHQVHYGPADLRAMLSSLTSAAKQAFSAREDAENVVEEMATLRADNAEAAARLAESRGQADEARGLAERLQQAQARLDATMRKLATSEADCDALRADLQYAASHSEALAKQEDDLAARERHVEEVLLEAQQAASPPHAYYDAELQQLRAQLADSEQHAAELREAAAKDTTLQDQLERYRGLLRSLAQREETVSLKEKEAAADIEQLQQQVARLTDSEADLQGQLAEQAAAHQQEQAASQASLQGMQSHVAGLEAAVRNAASLACHVDEVSEREQQLVLREATLEAKRADLDARESVLEERQRIAEREAESSERQATAHDSEAAAQRETLLARAAEVERRAAACHDSERSVIRMTSELESLALVLDEREAALRRREHDAAARASVPVPAVPASVSEELLAAHEALQGSEKACRSLAEQCDELRSDIGIMMNELDRVKDELIQERERTASLSSSQPALRQEREALAGEVVSLSDAVDRLGAEKADWHRQEQDYQVAASEYSETIAVLEKRLAEQFSDLAASKADRDEAATEAASLKRQLLAVKADTDPLDAELQTLRRSLEIAAAQRDQAEAGRQTAEAEMVAQREDLLRAKARLESEYQAAPPDAEAEGLRQRVAALEEDKLRLKDMLGRLKTAQQQVNAQLLNLGKEVEQKDGLIAQLLRSGSGATSVHSDPFDTDSLKR